MIDIRSTTAMNTRPCKYALAMQNHSVFADFDIDEFGCLYLVRISYDGFGCCRIDNADDINRINKTDSQLLIRSIEQNSLQRKTIQRIVLNHLKANAEHLWKDALEFHNLL